MNQTPTGEGGFEEEYCEDEEAKGADGAGEISFGIDGGD